MCQRNLYKFCKEIHPHIIQAPKNIETNTKELFDNLKLIKEVTEKESELIQYRLCFSYLNNIKHNSFNGFMYEILCEILKIDLKKEKQMFYLKNSTMIISKIIILNCYRMFRMEMYML